MGLSEAITDPKTLSANEPSETIARLQLDKYQAQDPRRIAIFRSLVSPNIGLMRPNTLMNRFGNGPSVSKMLQAKPSHQISERPAGLG